jgi:nitroreductase/NAD-dependent dihydropyrimidine dehydrogenase PreA subunit
MVIQLKINGINLSECIKCEECIKECPAHLFSKKTGADEICFEDPNNLCILCGHCLAVCPTNAVTAEETEGLYEFPEAKDPAKIASYEILLKALRARRSIRRFQKRPIPRDQIELVLQAMRYAPSASNAQNWNYIVVTDPQQIQEFGKQVMKIFYSLRKVLKLKQLLRVFVSGGTKLVLLDPKTPISVDRHIRAFEAGKDLIFYDAPCVILSHAPAYGSMAGVDGGIALTHGMLAAQSLGLGTCWMGYAQEAVQRDGNLRKWLQIPKGRNCYGAIALGYPAVKFHRVPPRKELTVHWI